MAFIMIVYHYFICYKCISCALLILIFEHLYHIPSFSYATMQNNTFYVCFDLTSLSFVANTVLWMKWFGMWGALPLLLDA